MRDRKQYVKDEQGRSESSETRTRLEQLHRNSSQIKSPKVELQDSEAWYRAIFNNTNDAIFLMDYDQFIDCNPKTLEMFGCTKEQIIGQRPYDRFSPRLQPDGQTSKDKALDKIRATLDGQPQFFEWRHLRYDGTPFEAEVSLNRVELFKHLYIQAFVRDVTKQKHTHLQYEMILKTAMDGFCIFDAHGHILEVNDAYCEMVGYSREELISMNIVDVEALESPPEVLKHIQLLMRSGSQRFETRQKRKDGKIIDLEVSAHCFKLDGHRLFAFFRNITEQKKAEAELRQERDRAQKYLDVAGVMFVALNKDGIVTLINQKGCEILSSDEKNIIGKNWFDNFLPKKIRKNVKGIFKKLMTGELVSVEYYENPVLTKSGIEKQIAWHNTVLKDESGKIVGTISSGEDITERKHAEQERLAHLHFFKSMDRINRAMIGTNNLEQMMSDVLDEVLSIFDCDRASLVYPCDPEAQSWTAPMERFRPPYEGVLALGLQVPMDDEVAFCHRLWRSSDGPVPFGQEHEIQMPHGIGERFQIQTQLGMAIYPKDDRPWLFVIHQCSRSRFWQEREIRLFQEIGRRLTDGLSSLLIYNELQESEQKLREHEEQLKLLASELSLAEERERRRIASGIHDDIAQRLALAKLGLQSIQNKILDSNIISSLKNQCETIDRIMEDARSLTFELSNPLLYEIGLEPAIESYLMEQIQEKCDIKCKFSSKGPHLSLDEDIRVVLYQGTRELLTNTVKYANASQVEVRIIKSNALISIVVEDDGIGFNPSKLDTPKRDKGGFGLFNIRERLEYLGGKLNIQSTPNKGTCVTMNIPLKLKATVHQKEILP